MASVPKALIPDTVTTLSTPTALLANLAAVLEKRTESPSITPKLSKLVAFLVVPSKALSTPVASTVMDKGVTVVLAVAVVLIKV